MSKMLDHMKAREASLTVDRVRELFNYDHETGVFTWRRDKYVRAGALAGSYTQDGYRLLVIDGVRYRAHRVAWLMFYGKWPDHLIDHINGICDDNRIINLRDVPNQVNQQNLRKARISSKTGVLGVKLNHTKTGFEARIQVNGERLLLGTYKTAEEAHSAYLQVKRKHHEGCTI